MVTDSGDLVILAVQRNGEDLGPDETVLAAGDTLLLQGTWAALDENLDDPAVLVVDPPGLVRRQAVPLGPGREARARRARGDGRPARDGRRPARRRGPARRLRDRAARRAQHRAVLPRDLLDDGDPRRRDDPALDRDGSRPARRGSWPTASSTSSATPARYALLLGLFVLTAVLGQLISNMATALIVIPVAISAAADMDVSAKPVLMAVTVAAAAVVPDPGRDACEPDGDGPGRLPLRRLLEARPAAARCSSASSRSCSSRSSGRSDGRPASSSRPGTSRRRSACRRWWPRRTSATAANDDGECSDVYPALAAVPRRPLRHLRRRRRRARLHGRRRRASSSRS